MAETYDVAVIGAGPGGYIAAIRASQLGLKTAVVERDRLGGICLNWGCIPTKALLRSAEVAHILHHLDDYGFSATGVAADFGKIIKRSRAVADRLSNGVKFLLKKHKVAVIDGEAKLLGQGQIAVAKDGKAQPEIAAKAIILATGARARTLPGLQPDGKRIWTYKEAMVPENLPKSLLVVGSGAIGIEFASFYRDLGSEVGVVEVLDRILPVEDAEISELARKALTKQGIKIETKATVKALKATGEGVTASIEAGGQTRELAVERVILAIGIAGNVEGIGLEATKAKVERGHVVVNPWCETGEPDLYAIGDLVGAPWLAHKAMHEGVLAAERIAGQSGLHPLDVTKIPSCTYCRPQIASVGLTERAAQEKGYTVKVGRFPFIGNGKAIAMGEPEGLVKTVFDSKTGELLGAHMIGAEVTELIQGFAIARTLESTEAELMASVFPHPTLSEMMHESVLDAYGRALHI